MSKDHRCGPKILDHFLKLSENSAYTPVTFNTHHVETSQNNSFKMTPYENPRQKSAHAHLMVPLMPWALTPQLLVYFLSREELWQRSPGQVDSKAVSPRAQGASTGTTAEPPISLQGQEHPAIPPAPLQGTLVFRRLTSYPNHLSSLSTSAVLICFPKIFLTWKIPLCLLLEFSSMRLLFHWCTCASYSNWTAQGRNFGKKLKRLPFSLCSHSYI